MVKWPMVYITERWGSIRQTFTSSDSTLWRDVTMRMWSPYWQIWLRIRNLMWSWWIPAFGTSAGTYILCIYPFATPVFHWNLSKHLEQWMWFKFTIKHFTHTAFTLTLESVLHFDPPTPGFHFDPKLSSWPCLVMLIDYPWENHACTLQVTCTCEKRISHTQGWLIWYSEFFQGFL